MTTFKEISGQLIRTLSSDPTPASTYEGQIWYNSTIGVLKGNTFTAAAWSSGGALGTARIGLQGAGTQTALLGFGGRTPAPPPTGASVVATEEYNGTSWSPGGNLNTARRYFAGCGTQTAGLAVSGWDNNNNNLNSTEKYNGSTWTTSTVLPYSARSIFGCGTQTDALVAGGYTSPLIGSSVTSTNEFDGSSWTGGGNMLNPRVAASAVGTTTAGLIWGGNTPNPSGAGDLNNTESYNGTSWTTVNAQVNLRSASGGRAGTQASALAFLGNPGSTSLVTEEWDGTNWAVNPATLAQARNNTGSDGNTTAAIGAGGYGSATYLGVTEEYNAAFYSTKTLTTS